MRDGRRWLALDADYMLNPFTDRLKTRFGAAGVCAFTGFLCACKRSTTPGTISYATDVEALILLGIDDLPLVDNSGVAWSLETLWRFTGQQKQTKKTRSGHRTYVSATHWGRWQKNLARQEDAQRKAHVRAGQRTDKSRTAGGHVAEPPVYRDWTEKEKEKETPLPPKGGESASQNGNYVGPGATKPLKAGKRGAAR
jgi:hypothetical protein